ESIFKEWARQQNAYFLYLLQYYPDESFFQYCLLQSRERYGVTPPGLPRGVAGAAVEESLYDVMTGSLAIQEMLQQRNLQGGAPRGDFNVHISALGPPRLQSLDYPRLLEDKRSKQQAVPKLQEIAKLVPEDQYFLHFNSMRSAGEL